MNDQTSMTAKQRRSLFNSMLKDLAAERDRLRAALAAVEQELADYGADVAPAAAKAAPAAPASAPAAKKKSRKKKAAKKQGAMRKGSLKDAMLAVVGADDMSITEITKAVLSGGYKTRSNALEKSVQIAAGQMVRDKQLKKPARGRYAKA